MAIDPALRLRPPPDGQRDRADVAATASRRPYRSILIILLPVAPLSLLAWCTRFYGRRRRDSVAEGIYRQALSVHPERVEALVGLGGVLMRQRRFQEAAGIWRQVLVLQPDTVNPLFQLSRALHRLGRLEEAVENYKLAASASVRLGTLHSAYDKAIVALEELAVRFLQGSPTADDVRQKAAFGIGKWLLTLPGDLSRQAATSIARAICTQAAVISLEAPDVALGKFHKALELAPDLPDALRGAAACFESLGQLDEALLALHRLVRIEPRAIEPRLQRDRLLAQVDGPAARHFDAKEQPSLISRMLGSPQVEEMRAKALRLLGSDAVPQGAGDANRREAARQKTAKIEQLLHVAKDAHSGGRLDEADSAYRSVLSLDENHVQALASYSRLLMRQRRFADAIRLLTRLRPLQPGSRETLELLARALLEEGQLAAAARHYARLSELDPNDVSVLLPLGRVYQRLSDWPAARDAWARLVDISPGTVEAHLGLATACQQTGEVDRAEAELQRVLERDPNHRRALTQLGRLQSAARPQAALTYWSKVVTLEPGTVEPLLQSGRIRLRLDQVEEAESFFRKVIEIDPDHSEALSSLGVIVGRRNIPEAVEFLDRWSSRAPGNIAPLIALARVYAEAKRIDSAEEAYLRALDLEPTNQTILVALGRLFTAATLHDKAMEVWSRLDELAPQSVEPRLQIARILYARQDPLAEDLLRSVLETDPKNREALQRLAQLMGRKQGMLDAALALWEEVANLDKTSIHAFTQRGRLLERAGRRDDAEAEYLRAVARDDRSPVALYTLGRFYRMRGRWEDALKLHKAHLQIEPKRIDVILGLGTCLDRLNRLDEAEELYDRALAEDPNNLDVLGYRGRMLRARGQVDAAIADFRRICELRPESGEAWRELIFYLAGAERADDALSALDQAEVALGGAPDALIALARAAESALFDDRAVVYFHRAIAAEPKNAAYHAQLGLHYFRRGVVDGAFHHLLDSRELDPTNVEVARALFDITRILMELGIDHLAMRREARTAGSILIPERLFALARRVAENAVEVYKPVPRRVVAISSTLAPGGAERQLVTMLRGLSEPTFDLDLSLFCTSLEPRFYRDFFLPILDGTGIDVVVLDPRSPAAYLADPEVAPFASIVRHFPPDMVAPIAFWLAEFRRRRPEVVHAWQDWTNLMAVVAALLAGVPKVILCCRSVRPDNPRRRLRRFMQLAYQAVLDHPSVVISNNSQAGADDYAEWLGIDPARIDVVYNGIDFDHLHRNAKPEETAQARRDLGIPDAAPILGGVYRMSEEKRPLLWLDVAAVVAREHPDVHFVICGDGPMRDEMAKYAVALGIADRVHMPGAQSNIGSWFKMMDVVMLTSRHEGLPNVLLEAQSLGVPVVAPNVGGMSEVVEQGVTGWTILDADAAKLAERVVFCLGNREWRAKAVERAPGFVRQRFGIETMLSRNLEVYGLNRPNRSGTLMS